MDFGKIFIRVVTRKETKVYTEYKNIESESDSQLLCSFISKNLDSKKIFEVTKSYEFNSLKGSFTTIYNLVEINKSMEDINA